MKNSAAIRMIGLALALIVVSTSCSTPTYRQNRYKTGKRYRNCGCQHQKINPGTMLSFNDQEK